MSSASKRLKSAFVRLIRVVRVPIPSPVNYHLSEIKHQIQSQSLIPLLDTDYSRLALWSVLTNGFEATDSWYIEQEGNISGREVGHGVQAILTSVRFFGGKYSQEYPVTRRINRKWSGRTLQSCPVKISMIALELRINQTFGTFTGDCIIIIFLPDTIICPRNTILPYTIWTCLLYTSPSPRD